MFDPRIVVTASCGVCGTCGACSLCPGGIIPTSVAATCADCLLFLLPK